MPEIKNRSAIIDRFGHWPSFHDAEVLSILLERGELGGSLTLRIHTWDVSAEVDASGYFILTNHTLVAMRFIGVVLETLRHFNRQNVISELRIEELTSAAPPLPAESYYFAADTTDLAFQVTIDSSYGCAALFKCKTAEVVAVEPFSVD